VQRVTGPTVFLTDADVRASFDWADAIEALRSTYAADVPETRYPPRTMARGDGVWLRTLSGVSADGETMGLKVIAASIKGRAASYLIPLFDQQTAELTALLDGNAITGFRTAATSALAADVLLAVEKPRVAVIGSGFEAQHHVRALTAVRTLSDVTVHSPNPASRERYVAALADLDVPVNATDSPAPAVADADLVICAARSRDESPTLLGQWLTPGTTVVSIGSTLPEQRELDTDVIARAELVVADNVHEVTQDTGDLIAAARAGVAFDHKVVALADVIAGSHPGRTSAEAVVVYKSVGSGVQDIAVAALCARRAAEHGLGTSLPATIRTVGK
jgi:alanine dehydrogenase